MGYLRLAMFAGLGILVAIVALPQTRWIARNHIGYLLGSGPADHYYGELDPANWSGNSQEEELARALQMNNMGWNQGSSKEELKTLEGYCRAHPDDAAAWAHLARLSLAKPLLTPGKPKTIDKPDVAARRKRYDDLLELATINGERLEPENVYFSLLKASLYESYGRHLEAQKTILAAQNKTSFNDHLSEEGDLLMKVASKRGYRGAAMELAVYAGLLLPHLSSVRKELPYIVRDEHGKSIPKMQMAMLRVCHTAAKHAGNVITVIVMSGVSKYVLAGVVERTVPLPDVKKPAAALDRALKTNEAESFLADYAKVNTDIVETLYPDSLYEEGIGQSIIAIWFLVSLVLAAPGIYTARGISELKLKLSTIPDRVTERPWLWSVWGLVVVLSLSAIVTGLVKSGPPQSLSSMFGVRKNEPTSLTGGGLTGIGTLCLLIAVIMIPRRSARFGVAVALAYTVLPFLYLASVLKSVQVDQRIKGVVTTFRTDVDEFRGKW